MKIEIEIYKGQAIYYDDDKDKFICDITVEEYSKSASRQSLNYVRREIDQFIKLNYEFKPFKAIERTYEWDFKIVEIEAIRTDGKFVVKDIFRSFYSKNKAETLMKFNPSIIAEQERINRIFEDAKKARELGLKALVEKLEPIDLSKYEGILK